MSDALNIDERIAELDANTEVQEWYIKRQEALKRLQENEDFQIVMLDGFIKLEADRVYNLLLNPRTAKHEDKDSLLHQLETIKDVIRYLGDETYKGTVNILGNNAKQIIDDNLRLKQELLTGKGE